MVSTHSRPKAAGRHRLPRPHQRSFNTQPPEGGCRNSQAQASKAKFQHTAARRRLQYPYCVAQAQRVSTHSRPKAAEAENRCTCYTDQGFNTQPPEGGCAQFRFASVLLSCFNTQPPEGGCAQFRFASVLLSCFNTQPPEGGWPFQTT